MWLEGEERVMIPIEPYRVGYPSLAIFPSSIATGGPASGTIQTSPPLSSCYLPIRRHENMGNAESCRRWRESRKHDPAWVAAEREKTRKRVAEHRARKKAKSVDPDEALLDELADLLGSDRP